MPQRSWLKLDEALKAGVNGRAAARTCSTVVPVMKAKAYSPCLGCRMSTHSLNDAVLSLAGFTAPLTCSNTFQNCYYAECSKALVPPVTGVLYSKAKLPIQEYVPEYCQELSVKVGKLMHPES